MVSLLLVPRYHSNRTYRFPHKLTTRHISGAYHSDLPLFLPLWITVLWYFAILYEVFSVNVKCLPSLINQAFPPLPSPYFSWRTPSVRLQPERCRTSSAIWTNAWFYWVFRHSISYLTTRLPLIFSLHKIRYSFHLIRQRTFSYMAIQIHRHLQRIMT